MSKPVIIGAGLAGLSVALALAPTPCLVVSPRKLGQGCSSSWAQGGIAAAIGADDTPTLHAADTMAAGAGLNDPAIVTQVTGDAPAIIDGLAKRGVPFDRDATGALRLGLEAAHGKRRIVHATDATGYAVMQAMIHAVRATPSIEVAEDVVALDLLVKNGIAGVVLKRGSEVGAFLSNRIVLACGGAAALWRDTTNPHENWGGGLALAARAGAALRDLEFMQFHPTAIDAGRDPMPLASEALRGEGAVLFDENGARFVDELQPRDIVARAIWAQIEAGHRVFLDAREALGASFKIRFPTIHALCAESGIDPATQPIPVRPAAHYHMGGIATDAQGRTDLPGLWASGEAACTGLHGANRLASNSLLEAASFGQRVAADIQSMPFGGAGFVPMQEAPNRTTTPEARARIRAAMSDDVGVVRTRAGLERVLALVAPLATTSDMALVAGMIVACALQREESRGAHSRADFPQTLAQGGASFYRLNESRAKDSNSNAA
jgi:L-aspartate oxidase